MENKEIMPYEKFVVYVLSRLTHGRRNIRGVFKEKGSKKIIKGDNFSCIVTGKGTADESYKDAIAYFNHTKIDKEKERVFVSAEWDKE